MGWVDIGIVAVLIGCAIFGFRRGFVQQAVELLGLLTGVMLGLYLTGGLVQNYAKPLAAYPITYPIVFLAIIGIALLVAQVVGRVAAEVMQVTFFGMFDQIGGAAAGLVKGMLWLSIAITIATHLGLGRHVDDQLRRSSLAGPLSRLLPAAFEMVKTYARDAPLREPFRSEPHATRSSR
jgi:uncharacterized membrane protein required for colicin V production